MLLDRQKKLIEYLKGNKSWVKGSEIAAVIDVTDRTVRSDINAIKKAYSEEFILSSRKLGYKYNDFSERSSEVKVNNNINGQQDRIMYIIKELLIHDDGVNIYDLAEKIFVSEFTIESDITKLKKVVNDINLDKINFSRKGQVIKIENNKKYTNNLLYDIGKFEVEDFDIEYMKRFFKDVDFDAIRIIVNKVFSKYNYASRYLSTTNLLIDIAISIEKSRVYNNSKVVKNSYDELEFDLFKLATEIVRDVENTFKVNISESIILTLANNLYRIKKIEVRENEIRRNDIKESKSYKFYKDKFKNLEGEFEVDLTENNQFIEDISVHTEIAIERIKLGIKLYNPLTYQLKNQFPFIFNVAINISKEISIINEIEFDLHETSYLVAYLGSALRIAQKDDNISILLLVLEGTSNLSYIHSQIVKINKNVNINVVGISSVYELEEIQNLNWDFDLVISTSILPKVNYNNHIIIKSSFTLADRVNVKESILKQIGNIKIKQFEGIFNSFFTEELFIRDIEATTKEETISKLVSVLKKQSYVDDVFEESVIEREKFVSTAIDTGVALPHALTMVAKKTGLIIGVLKNPVNWSGTKVRVVMLTALSKDRILYLNSYNEFITDIALDKEMVESIRKCSLFSDVKRILHEFYIGN